MRIVVDEYFFNGGAGRAMIGNNRREHRVEISQPVGQCRFRIGFNLTVGDMADPAAFDADDAPASAGQRRVEAKDDQPSFSITASGIS